MKKYLPGFICCSLAALSGFSQPATNSFLVNCPNGKTVQCGSVWAFDEPTATASCPVEFNTWSGVTNVIITSTGIVSNSMCPLVLTASWQLNDGCGDTNNCSQTVIVQGSGAMFSDAAADFAAGYASALNPNGHWTYGYSTTLGGLFMAYGAESANPPLEVWGGGPYGDTPSLSYNPTASDQITYFAGTDPPGGLVAVPVTGDGASWSYCVLRYTAPCTGEYTVNAQFLGAAKQEGTFTTVNLLTNNMVIYSGNVSGYGPGSGPIYSSNLSLLSGDWLDFVVGFSTNGNDNVGDAPTLISADVSCCCPGAPAVLQVNCPTNKTVQCGSGWTFDEPTATSTCICESNIAGGVSNVIITPTGIVSNSMSPLVLTETWSVIDGCGNSNTCSQTVTVQGSGVMFSDAAADFAAGYASQANPSLDGYWSYGYTATVGSAFVLYTNQSGINPQLEFWTVPGFLVWLVYNPATTAQSFGTGIDPPGWLMTHPGSGGLDSVLRFTAPCTGEYSVNAQFLGADPSGVSDDVYVLTNNTVIYSGYVSGYGAGSGPAYAMNLSMTNGTTLDFVVASNKFFPTDSTLISADVSWCCGDFTGLQVNCPSNKTVECGSGWTFDEPTATSYCTNGTNVIITSTGIVTNSMSPLTITESWFIADGCGNTNTCSQTVTVEGAMFSDAAADFAAGYASHSNPSLDGYWSYGYVTNLGTNIAGVFQGSVFVPYVTETNFGTPLQFWVGPFFGEYPFLYYNPTSSQQSFGTGIDPPGGLITHPGPDGQYAILRFTAPCTGEYAVNAQFLGADPNGTTTDVHLLSNGMVMFSGNVSGYGPGSGPVYAASWNLAAGTTLDFAVGYGTNDNYDFDSTLISADVSWCCSNGGNDCCADCVPPYPDSYTITVYPGINYLADDLCQGTNTTLANLLTNLPVGTMITLWDQKSQGFDKTDTYGPGGWASGTESVSFGDGFTLDNTTGKSYTITISGCPPSCPRPCEPVHGCTLVTGYGTNAPILWSDLFSCPPPCGTQFEIWNPVTQKFTTYTYVFGVWSPPLPFPILPVGQSALVCVNPNLCTNLGPVATNGTNVVTNYYGLSYTNISVFGWGYGAPTLLNYQWYQNGVPLPGQTASTISFASLAYSNAGAYTAVISNPYGSVTSAPTILTVLPPPTSPPVIPGLVMHLTFDNNLTDATGRGNNATNMASGGAILQTNDYESGVIGQAFYYDTEVDTNSVENGGFTNANYAIVGVRPDLQFGSNSFTVSMWVQLPSGYTGGDLPFFCDVIGSTFGHPGFCFEPSFGGTAGSSLPWPGAWAFSVFSEANTGAAIYGDVSSINDGNWHNLVYVIDQNYGPTVYLDGNVADENLQAGATVAAIGNINSPNAATIGQDPTGLYAQPSAGIMGIDDLGVWTRALTPLEAASIYEAGHYSGLSFTGAPISFTFTNLSGELVLNWNEGSLQCSTHLAGPWTTTIFTPPYTNSMTNQQTFFRVKF